MDLRQLNAVLAVAEHGGFSAAARALHTVQSNVSAHVARLEKELGATLIDRATGELTPEGEAVVGRARRIQAELASLDADVSSIQGEVSGAVTLGMIGTTARWLSPLLFDAVAREHPRVRLILIDATTTTLLPRLEAGELDLAVVNLPFDSREVLTTPLFEEDKIIVAPVDHPLAQKEYVDIAELAHHPLLLAAPGTGFRSELDTDVSQRGVVLTPRAEVDGVRLLASLAFQGYGAAVLPASAAPGWVGGDWKRVTIDGLTPRSVVLARRRRGLLSKAANAVAELVVDVVNKGADTVTGLRLPS
ncbi:MAG: LysR family transcriptional regulator [Actinomycetia bacterium]|nr:LysR family transcriptional regulator [Actinomycetes bacterium]MCP3912682.1 LysR family transcriptional regulator [Actinomycetes bacterium]MCP4087886.1 LysR family transcriptional regulator [Actinomycetes bacterium]